MKWKVESEKGVDIIKLLEAGASLEHFIKQINPDAIQSPIENEHKKEQECCYVDMLHCFACLPLLTRRHVGDKDVIGE